MDASAVQTRPQLVFTAHGKEVPTQRKSHARGFRQAAIVDAFTGFPELYMMPSYVTSDPCGIYVCHSSTARCTLRKYSSCRTAGSLGLDTCWLGLALNMTVSAVTQRSKHTLQWIAGRHQQPRHVQGNTVP